MNYHNDEWAFNKLNEHYKESLQYFPEHRIVGLFCQGSTNYGLDMEDSDFDTKLIIVPTFKDLAMNYKPISTTHVRDNDEHIDFKDVRLMFQTFLKQNLNFLEILFTPYCKVNDLYKEEWDKVVAAKESIAHYSTYLSIKAMQGVAINKYNSLEKVTPAKEKAIKKYGYDPKELHHLLRIEEFIDRYLNNESYAKCMVANSDNYLKAVKGGIYSLKQARETANRSKNHINKVCIKYFNENFCVCDENVKKLLDEVQYNIMKIAIKYEV